MTTLNISAMLVLSMKNKNIKGKSGFDGALLDLGISKKVNTNKKSRRKKLQDK